MRKRALVPPALRTRKTPGRRGAPYGNRYAFKHGKFTAERRALLADIRAHIARGRALLEAIKAANPPPEGG